ncbi:MAG TPA: FixH family protein [Ktedonobacteraceae bacterium]
MRVRPFVWIMLVATCAGVLIFAMNISLNKAVPLLAHIEQISTTGPGAALVRLRLTDSEGLPVDQARVTPQASMPNMPMEPQFTTVQPLGQGLYLTNINFSMTGSWEIDITAHADGFSTLKQSITIKVG